MADQVKLLGTWTSRYGRRVEMALKLKGVEYEYVEEDLYNKSALLLQHNPVHQKIPVLLHNGKAIAESLIILEYIDETWKNNPLLPQHPYDRAMARFWAKFIDEKLMLQSWWGKMKEDEEGSIEEFCELVKMLESQLKGKDFFGGDTIGYLDIAASMVAFWLPVIQEALGLEIVPAKRFPKLHQWTEKLLTVEAVAQCRPPREEHVKYMKKRLAYLVAASQTQ